MQVSLLLRNIPFETERTVFSHLNRRLGLRPSSEPFLSGDTYRSMADFVFDETGEFDPARAWNGSIIFVSVHRLEEFASRMLPSISGRFVLITHQGDPGIDREAARVADSPKISHWFAQNCLVEHPKITPLPIGLEDRWRHNNGSFSDFKRLSRMKGPSLPRIAYGFTLGTNLERRIECYRAMKRCGAAVELPQPLNSRLYRNAVKNYMMIASPPGNGIDCHRTWEAIYMKCVPIVEDSRMTRSFRDGGAPMVLVESWDEVTAWDEREVRDRYERAIAGSDARFAYADYWRAAIADKR